MEPQNHSPDKGRSRRSSTQDHTAQRYAKSAVYNRGHRQAPPYSSLSITPLLELGQPSPSGSTVEQQCPFCADRLTRQGIALEHITQSTIEFDPQYRGTRTRCQHHPERATVYLSADDNKNLSDVLVKIYRNDDYGG